MRKIDIANQIIIENGGIAKIVQLNENGIQNSEIKKMSEIGKPGIDYNWYAVFSRISAVEGSETNEKQKE